MFLKNVDDNFPSLVVKDPTRNGVILNFILKNTEGLVGDVNIGGILGCSDREVVEISIG